MEGVHSCYQLICVMGKDEYTCVPCTVYNLDADDTGQLPRRSSPQSLAATFFYPKSTVKYGYGK